MSSARREPPPSLGRYLLELALVRNIVAALVHLGFAVAGTPKEDPPQDPKHHRCKSGSCDGQVHRYWVLNLRGQGKSGRHCHTQSRLKPLEEPVGVVPFSHNLLDELALDE